jgi:hypothetical protein
MNREIVAQNKKGKLICFCLDFIDWDNRIIGFIKKINLETINFIEVNENGKKLPVQEINISRIVSIESGGIYNDCLEILCKVTKGKGVDSKAKKVKFSVTSRETKKKEVLLNLMKNHEISTFYFGSSFSLGFVSNIQESIFTVHDVSFLGKDDGFSTFKIKDLTMIRMNSHEENISKILYINRK